jgi:hypothetical protein
MKRARDAAGRRQRTSSAKSSGGVQVLMMMLGDGAFAIFRSV